MKKKFNFVLRNDYPFGWPSWLCGGDQMRGPGDEVGLQETIRACVLSNSRGVSF